MTERVDWQIIPGIVQQGDQIAFGRAGDRPCSQGRIEKAGGQERTDCFFLNGACCL